MNLRLFFQREMMLKLFFWFSVSVFTAIFLYRGSDNATFWMDEVYSIQMAHYDWSTIIEATAEDAHPPLYYFLLKIWIELLKAFGFGEGLLQARGFSFIALLIGTLTARYLMNNLFRANRANLICGLLLLSPTFSDAASDIRNYALTYVLILNSYCLFCLIVRDRNATFQKVKPQQLIRWIIYTLLLSTALWVHLLTGIAIAILGFTWLIVKDADEPKNWTFIWSGIISHSLILIFFFPWLKTLHTNLDYLSASPLIWMTPPTFKNLLHCYIENIFYGRVNFGYYVNSPNVILFSRIVMLITILFSAAAIFIYKQRKKKELPFSFPICFAAILFLLFPLTLWFLASWEILKVFHAPRYPQIVMPMGVVALILLLFSGPIRSFKINAIPVFLFFCAFAITYQSIYHNKGFWGIVPDGLKSLPANVTLPPDGSTVYVAPSFMVNYQTYLEDTYQLLPFDSIDPASFDGSSNFHLFYLNGWNLRNFDNIFVYQFMKNRPIDKQRESHYAIRENTFEIYELKNATPEELTALRSYQSPTPWPEIPEEAVRVFRPRDLEISQGWQEIEFDSYMNSFRWGASDRMIINVEPPLEEGEYTYRLIGFRHTMNGEKTELKITFGSETISKILKEGGFELKVPFTVPEGETISSIIIEHPKFQPVQYDENSGDERWLSFIYSASYILD